MQTQPTGQHLERLQNALLDAFDRVALAQLVRFGLDLDLEWITSAQDKRDLTKIVADLVAYCASQDGGFRRLFAAACEQNPNNHLLVTLASEWAGLQFASIPLPEDHKSTHAQQRGVTASGDIQESIIITGDGNTVQQIDTEDGINIQGNVETGNDFVGRDKIESDQINARDSKGFINRPTAPVTQHFGTMVNLGPVRIPKPIAGMLLTGLVVVVIFIGLMTQYVSGIFQFITAPTATPTLTIPTATPTATPLAFATQADGETLIVIATFRNTAATNSEAHTKIRRTIASEAANHNEQRLRIEVETTELSADQRSEAESLGKRYKASMVIWGEDTGVEVIVNFLNLKQPNLDAALATIIETERTQLANPSAYAHFITTDLPRTMSFFAFFAVGQSYYLNAQYTLAVERIESAVALVPSGAKPEGLADAYFRLGWLYQVPKPNNLNQAIVYYNKAIQLNPNSARDYNNRGIAWSDQAMLGKAIADYDKAIQINPNSARAYNNRGIALYNQRKWDAAVTDLDKAIQLNPNSANAYYNRGLIHSEQGELDDAIADYNKAIQLNPSFANAYYNYSNTYKDQRIVIVTLGDFDNSGTLDFYIAETCAAAEVCYNRGLVHSEQGELDNAIEAYNKAIQLNPNYARAYYNRGLARSEQDELDDAITDYNKAIQLNPNFANAYLGRGGIRNTQEKIDEAIADFRYYLQLQPSSGIRSQVEQIISGLETKLAEEK